MVVAARRELRVALDRALQLIDFNILEADVRLQQAETLKRSLRISNISRSGMFIETKDVIPLRQGASFNFAIRLDQDDEELKGTAKVCWIRPESSGPYQPCGVGVEVVEFQESSEKRYLAFLESCLLNLQITDLMDSNALQVDPEASVCDVISQMQVHQASCAVITDVEGMPLGIFTSGDLLRTGLSSAAHICRISDLMTPDPQTVSTGQSAEDVYALVKSGSFKQWPVLEEGVMVGLLSMRDMIRYWSEFMELQTKRLARSYDRTMSVIAHDLRTPLSIIHTTNLMMQNHQVTPDEYLSSGFSDVVAMNCETMMGLIDDLLDRGRISHGIVRLNRRFTAIDELLSRVVQSFAPAANHMGIRLEKRLPGWELPLVNIDPLRIEQALNNLISNALKFSPEDGVVQIGVKVLPGEVELWVSDHGPGIKPDELDRLFKDYSETSNRPLHGLEGTGLGLAIVKRLVEAHSGRIRVQTGLGLGTTFIITLPATGLHA